MEEYIVKAILDELDEIEELDKKPRKKRKKKEETLQVRIGIYMKMYHPDIIFNSDLSSGMHLPIGCAVKATKMRSKHEHPDMTFYEPRDKYCGLILELKHRREEVYKKDGTIRQNEHIQAQNEILEKLRKKGYYAVFSCGFEESIQIIEGYLKLPER